MSNTVFPTVVAQIIAEYCAEVKFRDWIHPGPILRQPEIYENPLAYDAGVLNLSHIDPRSSDYKNKSLCVTPDAECECLRHARANLSLKEFLHSAHNIKDSLSIYQYSNWIAYALCIKLYGIHKAADMCIDEIDELCNQVPILLFMEDLYEMNPIAIEDIIINGTTNYKGLSSNPHPRAIEYLRSHWNQIDIRRFAANPGIFHLKVDKKLIKLLSRRDYIVRNK